jgi:predicted metal-dependent phosphoesterase TrpH
MLKIELHSHTADDPLDRIPHTTLELIDHAAALGYGALAITLHERQLDVEPFASYALDRGLVLIPGVERTIHGRHVLLLNFRRGAEAVQTFEDIEQLKRSEPGLIIAPHPFFPLRNCLGPEMERWGHLFDAVEVNAMFTTGLNFNRRAERWAANNGKPLVGNGDVHRLPQLGRTYSLVDAAPSPDAICEAIAAGRVQVVSEPLSWGDAAQLMTRIVLGNFRFPWETTDPPDSLSRSEREPI